MHGSRGYRGPENMHYRRHRRCADGRSLARRLQDEYRGGLYPTSLYDLRVAVFDDEAQKWNGPTSVAAPRIHDLAGEFDAVLGRDVLQNGDLSLERSGAYSFVL